MQADLRYTGANVKDEPVVEDGTWITSRQPDDLPEFDRAIVQRLTGQVIPHDAQRVRAHATP